MAERLRHVLVLRRIKRTILQIGRLLENENFEESKRWINICLVNLNRIRYSIGVSKFSEIKSSLDNLNSYCEEESAHRGNNDECQYSAERYKSGRKGRPPVIISREQILFCRNEGYTAAKIAELLKCSKTVVYRRCYEEGLKFRDKYCNLSEDELSKKIKDLSKIYPKSGSEMMCALLKSQGFYVQRKRVREILSAVDPEETAIRWGNTVQRRSYSVPTPNSLWHMDAHLKLARWGFVTHACIDGYSRTITYAKCTTSMTAETVLNIFVPSVRQYGLPSRVRSDHGYENIFVALLMNCIRGLTRGSHLTGRSVHNQRIERLWRDLHTQVLSLFYDLFYNLENNGHLNVENEMNIFVLQYIFLDVINESLNTFVNAWNNHRIRTAQRNTPRQLWLSGMLNNMYSNHTATNEVFRRQSVHLRERVNQIFGNSQDNVIIPEEVYVSRLTAELVLSEEQKIALDQLKEGEQDPVDKYVSGVSFLRNFM